MSADLYDYFWTAQLKQGTSVLDELSGYTDSYQLAMSQAKQAAVTGWTISIFDNTGAVSHLVYTSTLEDE